MLTLTNQQNILQAHIISHVYVLHLNYPKSETFCCPTHNEGCGAVTQVGMPVFIDGAAVQLVNGVYYVPVSLLNCEGRRTCKIGLTKAFHDQLKLICNRVGIVSEVYSATDNNCITCDTWSEKRTIKKHESTLDMCRAVNGYAKVTLIDGGGATLKRSVPYNPEQIPKVQPAETQVTVEENSDDDNSDDLSVEEYNKLYDNERMDAKNKINNRKSAAARKLKRKV